MFLLGLSASRVAYSSGTRDLVSIHSLCSKVHSQHTVDLAVGNGLHDDLGRLVVDPATHTVGSTKNFLDDALQVLGEGLVAHSAGDLNDIVKGDGLVVLDVLLLLAIARRLFQGTDDQGRCSRNNRNCGLTVLNGKLDSHAQSTYPVASGLGDVLSDLLGRETKRTDLRRKRRRGADLTSSSTEVARYC
ncbi:hypothetical protein IF1G_01348 [Cordyceps javanica]|uniref:Uncharacterized protein n=1 Tax=Cordyceps javanica TaxID=43265 RepID=A0A545VBS0_9HYPO|nr:hypothetical protein IF1G_01348 [Cordyceps javanica]TQW11187.1 hypothetical protein IF2G_02129 [Cordyceps javanica]